MWPSPGSPERGPRQSVPSLGSQEGVLKLALLHMQELNPSGSLFYVQAGTVRGRVLAALMLRFLPGCGQAGSRCFGGAAALWLH